MAPQEWRSAKEATHARGLFEWHGGKRWLVKVILIALAQHLKAISFIFQGTRSPVVRCLIPLFWCAVVKWRQGVALLFWPDEKTTPWWENNSSCSYLGVVEGMENAWQGHSIYWMDILQGIQQVFLRKLLFRNIWWLWCIRRVYQTPSLKVKWSLLDVKSSFHGERKKKWRVCLWPIRCLLPQHIICCNEIWAYLAIASAMWLGLGQLLLK